MTEHEESSPELGSGELTHLDAQGAARMVEVGEKPVSDREAVAEGRVRMAPDTLRRLLDGSVPKGDVLATARIAGIQGAKRTPDLIPLCHHVALTGCKLAFAPEPSEGLLHITARVSAHDRTGVEMEALTAVSVAALTVYDMLKAVDREMVIEGIALMEKRGGRRGHYRRADGDG